MGLEKGLGGKTVRMKILLAKICRIMMVMIIKVMLNHVLSGPP